jgi:antitoxin YefM
MNGTNPHRLMGATVVTWEVASTLTNPFVMVILVTMFETRSLADVKAHLSELVAQVGAQHDRVTVTVHGRPTAVLMAVADLESLEETIAVLSDADALRALADADAELAAGEGESEAALRAAMAARRR